MTTIKPFKAVVYNPEKTPDLSSLICPPYDIISPSRQEYYHKLNPYNFIQILLGKDIPGEDKYIRAADYFKRWQEEKIFIQDERPAIYFYSQQYTIRGEKKIRLGFMALLRLEEKNPTVFGHERTHSQPKEDRLKLLKSTKANLCPIFVIFLDKKRIIPRIFQQYLPGQKPFIDMVDDEKITHKLWRIDSADILDKIQTQMQSENIFIADGHHRYEVACIYREQMKRTLGTIIQEEDFNYILTYFTNIDPHSLSILPVHRLLKLNSRIDMGNLLSCLKEYFDIEEVKDKIRFFFLMEKAGMHEHVLGMYKDARFWLLRLKNVKILDKVMQDKPPEFRALDVSILNFLILNKLLGPDSQEGIVVFSHNAEEIMSEADNHPCSLAFLLNPLKVSQITAVALSGEKMPPKSTYFYPKVPSGLLINKHQD